MPDEAVSPQSSPDTLEQGKADRSQTSAAAKPSLVDPNPAPDRKTDPRPRPFNLAIDSKLRGCDVVALRVEDVAPNGYAVERATVRQKKTGGAGQVRVNGSNPASR
jgi:hypothetical protein